jgi:hypothetical protein
LAWCLLGVAGHPRVASGTASFSHRRRADAVAGLAVKEEGAAETALELDVVGHDLVDGGEPGHRCVATQAANQLAEQQQWGEAWTDSGYL